MPIERNDQEHIRRQRREQLLARRIDVYPARSARTSTISQVLNQWSEDKHVDIAGRVRAIRTQGKSSFLQLQDETGELQIFLQSKNLADYADLIGLLDLGDFLDVSGQTFVTKRGEKSIDAQSCSWLAKALRPLPSSWHGLADVETRYRFRELDLLANETAKNVFAIRAQILSALRSFLSQQGFTEVETPMLQTIPGGATAQPFATHHNALDVDLYLRVAPELYLKRLIVGGFGRVFEIGRNFRNEGIDREHNPEFTMLECYAAFTDYRWMMDFTEQMLRSVTTAINGRPEVVIGETTYALDKPMTRLSYHQAVLSATGIDIDRADDDGLRVQGRAKGTDLTDTMSRPAMIDQIFKTHVRPKLLAPTIVFDYPLALSPLAKKKFDQPTYTERFQILMGGTEIGNAFSELNDPVDQRERFLAQERLRAAGDAEAQSIDETYLRSLEYGMPPTSGLGIGIDRLVAIITKSNTLKDVILFPTLKSERP